MAAAACGLVALLAADDAACARLGAGGAVPAVLAAVGAHAAAHAGVRAEGMRALMYLAFDPGNRALLLAHGAVDAAVAVLDAHPADAALQHSGCVLLANVALFLPARPVIATRGGLATVVRALRAHRGFSDLPYYACHALGQLASRSPARQHAIVAAGGLEAVVAAVVSPAGTPLADSMARRALARLAADNDLLQILAWQQPGALAALVPASPSAPPLHFDLFSTLSSSGAVFTAPPAEARAATDDALEQLWALAPNLSPTQCGYACRTIYRYACRYPGRLAALARPASSDIIREPLPPFPRGTDSVGNRLQHLVLLWRQAAHAPFAAPPL